MSTKQADAKKLIEEIIRSMESRSERVRTKNLDNSEMDRRLRQVKWFLGLMIPVTLLMLAY